MCSTLGDEHTQENNCHPSDARTLKDTSTNADTHISFSSGPLPPSYALQGRIWLSLQKSVVLSVFFRKRGFKGVKIHLHQNSVLMVRVWCSLRSSHSYNIHAWWLIAGWKQCIILSHVTFFCLRLVSQPWMSFPLMPTGETEHVAYMA